MGIINRIFFLLIVSTLLVVIQAESSIAAEIPSKLKALHVLNRLGFGPRPGDVDRVNAMGVDAYIREQLYPENIPLPDKINRELEQLETYSMTPAQLLQEYGPPVKVKGQKPDRALIRQRRQEARLIVEQATKARLLQAIESPRQLQELLVDFWYNHFNVYAKKGEDALWVGAYEREAIRPNVLGHFRDLLRATAKHPAMLFYLDNWQNVDPNSQRIVRRKKAKIRGLNENYARELMELHTLGVNGGYTQDDVIALARILTGLGFHAKWRAHPEDDLFFFDVHKHDGSDKEFLGQVIHGRGEDEIDDVLDILARSPATAKHISFQLAQYFVSDNPDSGLVERMTKKFESTDGDIRAVLKVLFESPEFWDEANDANKFKTPYQYVVSAIRATGQEVTNYRPMIGMLAQLGMPLYGSLTPDGYKNTQEAWLSSDSMLRRINFATALGNGSLRINNDKKPIEYEDVINALGNQLSLQTKDAIDNAPVRLKAALILGSPEMMKK